MRSWRCKGSPDREGRLTKQWGTKRNEMVYLGFFGYSSQIRTHPTVLRTPMLEYACTMHAEKGKIFMEICTATGAILYSPSYLLRSAKLLMPRYG